MGLSCFLAPSLADLWLTWLLIEHGGGWVRESNPIANAWLSHFGWSGLAIFKLIVMGLVVVIVGLLLRSRPLRRSDGCAFRMRGGGRGRTLQLSLTLGCSKPGARGIGARRHRPGARAHPREACSASDVTRCGPDLSARGTSSGWASRRRRRTTDRDCGRCWHDTAEERGRRWQCDCATPPRVSWSASFGRRR